MLRIAVIFLASVFASFPYASARAQWVHTMKENAFDEAKNMNIALVVNSGDFGFGFICQGQNEVALRLISPESWNNQFADVAKLGKMKVRVDKGRIHEFDFTAQDAGGRTLLEARSLETLPVAKEIISAKRRVAVGVFLLDRPTYNENFGVRRSAQASKKRFLDAN